MRSKLNVRLIKRNQREILQSPVDRGSEAQSLDEEQRCKTIVSTWVREHRLRTKLMRQNLRDLLRDKGFLASTVPSTVSAE